MQSVLKRSIWGRMGEVKSCMGYVGETNRHPAEFCYLLGIQRHTCIGNNLGINYQKYGENDQT